MTDEALVEVIRSNDKERYAELVSRYQERLFRYATYLVRDTETAADIIQTAFIKAFINLNGFDTTKIFSTWMYRIVHNEAMNVVSKYSKETVLPDNFEIESEDNLEDQLDQRDIERQVKHCLQQLPVLYAEPLSLYYLDDTSYEEISDILRVPLGTVSTRIRRGKGLLRHLCTHNT